MLGGVIHQTQLLVQCFITNSFIYFLQPISWSSLASSSLNYEEPLLIISSALQIHNRFYVSFLSSNNIKIPSLKKFNIFQNREHLG